MVVRGRDVARRLAGRFGLGRPVHAGVSDDLDVLVAAMQPIASRHFLSISAHGAGEAALCLAAAGADQVLAHDVGDASALDHLVALKLTAAHLFGREDYLALMGLRVASRMRRQALVDQVLRGLGAYEQRYWKKRRRALLGGLFHADRVGLFFEGFLAALRLLGSKPLRDTIVFGATEDERIAAFREAVDHGWLREGLAQIGERANLFFPDAEWEASEYPRAFNRDPIAYLERLVAAGLGDNPLFAHHVRKDEPIPEALLPPHLRPLVYDGLRGAAPRVRVVRSRLLAEGPSASGAYLSNVVDFLDALAREALFAALFARLDPGAPVLVYSNEAFDKVPVGDRFALDEDASARLARMDRAKIYRRVALYRRSGTPAEDGDPRAARLRIVH